MRPFPFVGSRRDDVVMMSECDEGEKKPRRSRRQQQEQSMRRWPPQTLQTHNTRHNRIPNHPSI
jgi:hypothetical protein